MSALATTTQTVATNCQRAMEGVGAGIGSSLRGVDCAANEMAQAAFNRLFTTDGYLGPTLTILLTLFIALLGFALMTGRTRIGLSTLTPKMVTLVGVVTFATSWFVFQNVFFNLFVLGPDSIATALMGTQGSATTIFADKLDSLMLLMVQATGESAMDANTSVFSPPGLLWSGGTMLLLGTVGLLATTKIALAILMGLGPLFIVCALFDATRGLFTGWLKGVVVMALAPLFAVLGGSLMLELSIPVLNDLAQKPGEVDVRPAMAFFMIGAVHLALMFIVMKVLGSMVSGWTVFGLVRDRRGDRMAAAAAAAMAAPLAARASAPAPAAAAGPARAAQIAPPPAREVRVSGALPLAANDAGAAQVGRETRVVGGTTIAGAAGAAANPLSRARGIGSRFKSAPIRQPETSR